MSHIIFLRYFTFLTSSWRRPILIRLIKVFDSWKRKFVHSFSLDDDSGKKWIFRFHVQLNHGWSKTFVPLNWFWNSIDLKFYFLMKWVELRLDFIFSSCVFFLIHPFFRSSFRNLSKTYSIEVDVSIIYLSLNLLFVSSWFSYCLWFPVCKFKSLCHRRYFFKMIFIWI